MREASDGNVTIVIKSQATPQASSSTTTGVLASITQHPPSQPIPRRAAPGAAPTQERDPPGVGTTDEAGGLYKCGWCSRKYTTAHSMRRHVRSEHEQERFRCRHCGAEYKRADRRNAHQRQCLQGPAYRARYSTQRKTSRQTEKTKQSSPQRPSEERRQHAHQERPSSSSREGGWTSSLTKGKSRDQRLPPD